ncbi:MAG: class I mannose-6-phosphate isomerase [Bifidobacteriaceae bacterium]|jgi:hypothetical protein|nr:class I mannose-6-phosphate isomerase [Bifidobacteriaceae bacterium]
MSLASIPDHWIQRAARAPRNFDLRPRQPLCHGDTVLRGGQLWRHVGELAARRAGERAPLVVVDCYPGVEVAELAGVIRAAFPGWRLVDVEQTALPVEEIDQMIAPALTDDRVFGRMTHFTLPEFYHAGHLSALGAELSKRLVPVVVVGWGAALAAPDADVVVLADMARWEIQLRQRAGQPNWRCQNGGQDPLRKYKRSFFVEWRTADRHKRTLFERLDLVLDTNRGAVDATAITGAAFRRALAATGQRPFRLVPYFDPGVWGGYWLETMFDLPKAEGNYAWCFDCVPEENSLLFSDGSGFDVELPALDLVLLEPRRLLGERAFARFGAEFPIRFDLLDTMGGGNLSLQVHPLTDYIQQAFGMAYTQDESYYILDCEQGAVVYLGLRAGAGPEETFAALVRAQGGGEDFPASDFVNTFPVRKHDHFSIPAGTVHCSGANCLVLEISATPYIFTFKLWDWGRVGLDGLPRPVHLDYGAANIQWARDTTWIKGNLVGRVDLLLDEPDHREERTGLHELEFIEVRRHWFGGEIDLDTRGTLNVLNLVAGRAAEVVSPTGAFAPFAVHYAETFIVPAAVGAYSLRPSQPGAECGVVVASVRGTEIPRG